MYSGNNSWVTEYGKDYPRHFGKVFMIIQKFVIMHSVAGVHHTFPTDMLYGALYCMFDTH